MRCQMCEAPLTADEAQEGPLGAPACDGCSEAWLLAVAEDAAHEAAHRVAAEDAAVKAAAGLVLAGRPLDALRTLEAVSAL